MNSEPIISLKSKLLLPHPETDKYSSTNFSVMEKDYSSFDINALQAEFELKCSQFDEAIKKNKELAELRKIFHEMKILHTRIAQWRHCTGVSPARDQPL
jgi:hypothetical protein